MHFSAQSFALGRAGTKLSGDVYEKCNMELDKHIRAEKNTMKKAGCTGALLARHLWTAEFDYH